jgi:predicted GNAT family acetyltransferase
MSAMDGFDFFCLRHKGELVSTLLSFSDSGVAGLYFIATQPEHREKGYAGNLIRYVLNFLFNQGKEKVVLQSDRKAVPLYLRAGFIPVGQMVVLRKI